MVKIHCNFALEKPIKPSYMKITKILILLIAFLAVSTGLEAQNQSSNSLGELTLKSKGKITSHRPKAPSLQRITCVYDGENLVFDFVLPEGQCELSVRGIDNGYVVTETFDLSDLVAEVFVGTITDCEIELTTSLGHTYSGVLYVGNE